MPTTSHTCKLLIVDDEHEIRQGLQNFDYAPLSIEVAAICNNGLEALRALGDQPVDILLTDIRMPYMDGLELIEKATKLYPYMQKIVLSGHDEFEYAKKGMAHGVLDFLLKPLDFGEYYRALDRAATVVRQAKERHLQAAALERKAKLSARLLRRNFLGELLRRPMTPETIETESAASEVYFEPGGACFVAVLRFECYPQRPRSMGDGEWSLTLFTLDNLLNDLWSENGYGCHVVDDATGQCALIATDAQLAADLRLGGGEAVRLIEETIDSLMRFRRLFKSRFSYAVGKVVTDPSELRLSYLEAVAKLRHTVADALDAERREEGEDAAGEAFDAGQANARRLVQEAKRYIEDHHDRSITLDDVAAHVHLNPSYLSHLFKEMTGRKYIDYLTSYRIEKAKHYLASHNHKIYEVGEMVGYENPRYFNQIFKKYTAQSPLEYRNSHYGADARTKRP